MTVITTTMTTTTTTTVTPTLKGPAALAKVGVASDGTVAAALSISSGLLPF